MAKDVVKMLSISQASRLSGGVIGVNRLRNLAKEPGCEFAVNKGKRTIYIREREFINWLDTTKKLQKKGMDKRVLAPYPLW